MLCSKVLVHLFKKFLYLLVGTRSAKRFQEAIDQIIRYNNKVDLDHYNEAAWHFNGEQITEGIKNKMRKIPYHRNSSKI